MDEMVIGTSAYPTADPDLMKGAGVGWVRAGLAVPWADASRTVPSKAYLQRKDRLEAWRECGLKVIAITPLPGGSRYVRDADGSLHLRWTSRLPAWFGPVGSDEWAETYGHMCRFLAEDVGDNVGLWQIANELDIELFAGPLSVEQAASLVEAAARGLKAGRPSALVGHNPAGGDRADALYRRLYVSGEGLLDYCGTDGYYGTWAPGGPQDWAGRVAGLAALSGRPVFVNEWGFASKGELATPGEIPTGVPPCTVGKWKYTWGPGHTPEGQAAFVREALEAFAVVRDHLLGICFYRWEDQERCWQCGREGCPMETAWGLTDSAYRPKPAMAAFREGAARLRQGG